MVEVTLKWDKHAASLVPHEAVRKATEWGGRDALRALRTGAGRKVRERKALSLKLVSGAMGTHSPPKGTRLDHLAWTLTVSGKAVPMRDYPHRDTGRTGVWVTVNKGHRVKLRHAFEVRLRNGHVGIFERAQGVPRLPIKELFTTRVSEPVGDAAPELLRKAQDTFSATWRRVVAAELAGKFTRK